MRALLPVCAGLSLSVAVAACGGGVVGFCPSGFYDTGGQVCSSSGRLVPECGQIGYEASPPAVPYCDLGGGQCVLGACPGVCPSGFYDTGAQACSSSGRIEPDCCPLAAADCGAPLPFCDLGGGACSPQQSATFQVTVCTGGKLASITPTTCSDGVHTPGGGNCELGACPTDAGP